MANYDYYDNAFWGNLGEGGLGDILKGGLVSAWNGIQGITSTWGVNTANAAISGAFSALGTISSARAASNVYSYFKKQENEYIQNAIEQSRRTQLKGDIALRNLRIKHLTMQGQNELAVASAGGNMSGSFLDKLVQNHKYNTMDERTSSIQTLWDVSNAKRAGYARAISAAGHAMSTAYTQRNNALAGLTSFAKTMTAGILADKRAEQQLDYLQKMSNLTNQYNWDATVAKYGDGVEQPGLKIDTNAVPTLQIDGGSLLNINSGELYG